MKQSPIEETRERTALNCHELILSRIPSFNSAILLRVNGSVASHALYCGPPRTPKGKRTVSRGSARDGKDERLLFAMFLLVIA